MRLNNEQMSIVVDEIFKQVSESIIKNNEKLLESASYEEDEYLLDAKKYNELQEIIDKLKKQQEQLIEKHWPQIGGWRSNVFSNNTVDNYIKKLKQNSLSIKEPPTKQDIKKEIILSGNKDIPALIELIVNKLKIEE